MEEQYPENVNQLEKLIEEFDKRLRESTSQISDADHVDKFIPYLQAALPFIVRGVLDSKFLNFLRNHIMPNFDKLPEPSKLDLLKSLAEISPHTTASVSLQMLPSIVQLLENIMPAKKTQAKSDCKYIECLLYVFHHMAHKVPTATNSLCGYKFVTKQPSDRIGDNFSKLYKEFTERHAYSLVTLPNMDALNTLIEHYLFLEDLLDKLISDTFCELEDEEHVKWLLGFSGFQQAKDTSPESGGFFLHESPEVGWLFWKINQSKLFRLLTPESWNEIVGYVRNQLNHLLCWAYVSSDLVSAMRIIRNWEVEYIPLCPWYLCAFVSPEYLGTDVSVEEGHFCYRNWVEDALLYTKDNGIPEEICKQFDCSDGEPPNADELQMGKRKIKSIRIIDSMEAALLLLPHQLIGADLIAFTNLWKKGEQIYYGPGPNSNFHSYHVVIITAVEVYNGEVVAVCKMSNGTKAANNGFVRVSLATMYMVVGINPKKIEYVRGTSKPMHLLSNFVILDMDEKEKEREEEIEKQEDADHVDRGKRPANGAGNDVGAKKARTESSGCEQGI